MEYDLYICTETKQAWTSLTSAARPRTPARLQTHLQINVYFFDSTADTPAAALLDSYDAMRIALKPAGTPSADPLIYSASPTEDADHYVFEWDQIDGADLRTLLGDERQVEVQFELAWTIDAVVERVAWPAVCENAVVRNTDGAPDPEEDASDAFVEARAVLYDRAQTLTTVEAAQALANLGISGIKTASIVRGCLRLVLTNDDVTHLPLTSGEPPAL